MPSDEKRSRLSTAEDESNARRTLSHISMAFLYVSEVGSFELHLLKQSAALPNCSSALGFSVQRKPSDV